MPAADLHIDARAEYHHLEAAYDAFARLVDAPDDALFARNAAVSEWSMAQHLFHVLKANGMMLKAAQVLAQGAGDVGQSLSDAGRQVLLDEKMPRGQYDAPESVQPVDQPSRADVQDALRRSRQKLDALEPILGDLPDATGRFPHTFMGPLNAIEWLRTARLHTAHHLGIAREIIGGEPPMDG